MPAGTTAAAGVVSQGDWTLGLSASALSGLSSAYAGVYFEKYVKGKMSSTLWIRNLQLGIYGLPLSIAYMYAKDHSNLRHGGIMQVGTGLLIPHFAAQSFRAALQSSGACGRTHSASKKSQHTCSTQS